MKNISFNKLVASLALMFAALTASAANKLYIEPFTIADYQPVTVNIMLDNSDAVATAGFTIVLPSQLEMVSGPVKNDDRFASMQTLSYNDANGKVTITSFGLLPFKGNEGAIASFQVKAKAGAFTTAFFTQDLTLDDIVLGLATGAGVETDKTTSATVTFANANFEFTVPAEPYTVAPAESFTMSVGLTNTIAVKGMQFRVALPEGFKADLESFKTNERCPGGAMAIATEIPGNKVNVQVIDISGSPVISEAGEGTFLTFNVIAAPEFEADTENVTFENIVLSVDNNFSWSLDPVTSVVRNTYPSYVSAMMLVQQLTQEFEAAIAEVDTDCPDVAESFMEQESAIVESIDALSSAIAQANADKSLIDNYDTVTGAATDIRAAIAKLIEDAKAAQAQFEADKAEAARQAANQQAYDADLATIAAFQQSLDQAKATIAEEYEGFGNEEAEAAVQARIDALKAAADAAFKAVETEGEYSCTLDTEGLAEAIDALVTDAQDAKAAAEAEAARQAANQIAYDADLAVIASFQQSLDQANATIAEEYEGFANEEAAAAVQTRIAGMKEAADAALAAVAEEGEYTSPLDTEGLADAIAALITDAQDAKAAAEAEAARQAANKIAYDADIAEIASFQQALNEANAKIEAEFPDYADAEAAAAVQTRIDGLNTAVAAAYAAVAEEGEYASPLDTEGLAEAIATLVANAEAAKGQADAEAARQAANQVAYNATLAEIASFQQSLDDAKATIAKEYAGFGNEEAAAAVQARIDGLKDAADAAFAAVATEGEYACTLDTEGLAEAIAALVADAKAAKDAADEETARQVANQAAYNATLAEIASFQQSLDDANATIAKEYAGFGNEEAAATVQARIDGLKDAADAAFAAVAAEGEYACTLDTEGLAEAIAALVADAKAAKDAADAEAAAEAARQAANKAAYDADLDAISDLFADYRKVVAEIQADYAAYEDLSAELAVRNALDAAKDDVEKAYKAVAAEGNYSYVLDAEGLKASIDKLLADAKDRKAAADAEAARQAANKAAYDADMAVVNGLQAKLDELVNTIDEQYPNWHDQERIDAIADMISDLKDKVDAAYAAVAEEGEYESPVNETEINTIEDAIARFADDAASIVDVMFGEDADAEYYTLDGIKLAKPMKGVVNIVRTGDKFVKILVR